MTTHQAVDDADQEEEFEQASRRQAETIYEAEKGIGLMHGVVVMQEYEPPKR